MKTLNASSKKKKIIRRKKSNIVYTEAIRFSLKIIAKLERGKRNDQ